MRSEQMADAVILLVEDNPDIRIGMFHMFREM